MNIIFSRELDNDLDKKFEEDIKEIFDEIINGEEMKKYKHLDITLNNISKEEYEIIRNYVGSGVDFDLNKHVFINKAISGSVRIFNITLNQEESDYMQDTFCSFYPYTYTQIKFTFRNVLKDIINKIKNNSLSDKDIDSYNDDTKTLLDQELETNLQRLLNKKLHEKGFIYVSEFAEEGERMSSDDIINKYKEELIYRLKSFKNKSVLSEITRTEITLPYNHADLTILDKYGIYNVRLYASNDGFLYTEPFSSSYQEVYDYGEYSFFECAIEDKDLLTPIIEETRKAINKYLEDISKEKI